MLKTTVIVVCMLLCASLIVADESKDYFHGRSGNVLIESADASEQHSEMHSLELGHDAKQEQEQDESPSDAKVLPLTDLQVAEHVSHAIGVPSHGAKHASSNAHTRSTARVFRKSRANVLITIDQGRVDTHAHRTPLRNLLRRARRYRLRHSRLHSTLAHRVSMLTGHRASVHGIVSRAWHLKNKLVHAFRTKHPKCHAVRGNTADVLTQLYKGKSLVVSMSADRVHARAALHHASSPARNLANVVQLSVLDNTMASRLDETHNSLARFTVSLDDLNLLPNVDVAALRKLPTHQLAHYLECASLYKLAQTLAEQDDLKKLVADNVPDFFAIHFSALRSFDAADNDAAAQASLTMDLAIQNLLRSLRSQYGRISAQIIRMPNHMRHRHVAPAHLEHILKQLRNHLGDALLTDAHSLKHTFPHVHVRNAVGHDICASINSNLQASKAPVRVRCLAAAPAHASHARHLNAFLGETNNTNTTVDLDNTYTALEIEHYQIALFVLLFVSLGALLACCAFCGWEEDTLLYRSNVGKVKTR